MRFEGRDLKPYANPISRELLKLDSIYYLVSFIDDEMCAPIMETVVFVGENLDAADNGRFYFQDLRSYEEGVRYDSPKKTQYALKCEESGLNSIYEFEDALDELMRCSLRRAAKGS